MAERVRFRIEGENRTDLAFRQVETNLQRMQRRVETVSRVFVSAFAATAVVRLTGEIARASVQMERFERGLRAATGSAAQSAAELAFVREQADRLGLNLESAAEQYTKLTAAARGTTLAGQASRDIFVAVSEASRVLGLSAEQTGGALTAIEQIISKGKVSAEELRGQLGERLPGAFQIAARSIGVTTAKLDEMLKQGKLTAEELLPAMARELRSTFGPEVESAANDAAAAYERFRTAVFDLKVAIADSGLIGALSSLADFSAAAARGIGAALGNTSPVPFESEIRKLEQFIDLRRDLAREGFLQDFEFEELNEAIAKLIELRHLQQQSLGLGAGGAVPVAPTGDAIVSEVNAELEKIRLSNRIGPIELRVKPKFELLDPTKPGLQEIELPDIAKVPVKMTPTIDLLDVEEELAKVNTSFGTFRDSLAAGLSDALTSAFLGIDQEWDELLKRMAARFFSEQFVGALFGAFGGAVGDNTGILGKMFGKPTARASGGGFTAGQPLMIGERGPELVRFGRGGTVDKMGGARGGLNVVVHNHVGAQVTTERRERSNGMSELLVTIGQMVDRNLASGAHDDTFRGRFGLAPALAGRR